MRSRKTRTYARRRVNRVAHHVVVAPREPIRQCAHPPRTGAQAWRNEASSFGAPSPKPPLSPEPPSAAPPGSQNDPAFQNAHSGWSMALKRGHKREDPSEKKERNSRQEKEKNANFWAHPWDPTLLAPTLGTPPSGPTWARPVWANPTEASPSLARSASPS